MINYCCSRCGEKVPLEYAYRVDVTDSPSIKMLEQKKSYILCRSCHIYLDDWMEEDNKKEGNTNEHN